MKLWIDDFRAPPEDWPDLETVWAKTLDEVWDCWDLYEITEVSFDHDLGVLISSDKPLPDYQTTMPFARYIEERASAGIKPPKWSVHSMNPIGAANLRATLESADRLYEKAHEA